MLGRSGGHRVPRKNNNGNPQISQMTQMTQIETTKLNNMTTQGPATTRSDVVVPSCRCGSAVVGNLRNLRNLRMRSFRFTPCATQ
jgi:hypothetical protein